MPRTGGLTRRWPLGTADATVHHGGADDPVRPLVASHGARFAGPLHSASGYHDRKFEHPIV